MLTALLGIVAPVFALVALGAWLRRSGVLDPESISRLAFYVLIPALVFSSLADTRVPLADFGRIGLGVVLLAATTYALGAVVCRLAAAPDETRASYLLSTTFMNAGNFGLPVVLFAFGQDGFDVAVLYYVAQSFLANSLGAYVASRGATSARSALQNALRAPTLYAALLALPFLLLGAPPPQAALAPVQLVGRAAIPLMLFLLGAQLRPHATSIPARLLLLAVSTRLLISPAMAAILAGGVGLKGETAAVFTVESGMPTAVITVVLSMRFGANTGLLSGVIAYSTMGSLITVPILLEVLR